MAILDFNGCFLKIYKNECLEPLGGLNKLKIQMDSLWDILKNLSIRFLVFQLFVIFGPRKMQNWLKTPKNADFWTKGPKNREKLKYQKFDK